MAGQPALPGWSRPAGKSGFSCDRAKDLHWLFVRETIEPRRTHNVDAFFQFAEKLGVPVPAVPEWRLPVDPAAQGWAAEALPNVPFIAISPCASKAERNWAAQNYAAVARELQRRHGLAVVLLGGPAAEERAMAEKIAMELAGPVCNLVGTTRLPQMVATLARARLLLAPDTGAVHIANVSGRPVIGSLHRAQAPAPARTKTASSASTATRKPCGNFCTRNPRGNSGNCGCTIRGR